MSPLPANGSAKSCRPEFEFEPPPCRPGKSCELVLPMSQLTILCPKWEPTSSAGHIHCCCQTTKRAHRFTQHCKTQGSSCFSFTTFVLLLNQLHSATVGVMHEQGTLACGLPSWCMSIICLPGAQYE
ncbi:hypothetical protein GQ54DRAFT_176158 [Martensiomyces pterosporus]|nr:hypothetical protein GQ54DRAFT_176158 [Martensiomyces pterosporus]